MNKKGFTLVELIAVLALLGIIVGISVVSISSVFKNTKNKTEDVFVDTIKDAMDMYLDSDVDLSEDLVNWVECTKRLNKSHGSVMMYRSTITFNSVINSEFKPIKKEDLVNPANKDVSCKDPSLITVTIYSDDDYVYYYSIDKSAFGCLKGTGVISNLPIINDSGDYYTCN